MKKNYSISVIIPNYNGKHLLEQNLPSVYESLSLSNILDFEIIVADDASQDDSIVFLKENYPTIILIENQVNKGFGGNINTGIRKASKDLVFLLNSDVQLTGSYFAPQLPYFEKADTFGVVGGLYNTNTFHLQDGAKFPKYSWVNIDNNKNYIPAKLDEIKVWLPTFFLCGANALIDRKKLLLLQGFDELLNPYYGEDVELSFRAWRLGFWCYYEPSSVCYHDTSSTIKKHTKPEKVKIIAKRNKMFVHDLHLEGSSRVAYHCVLWLKVFFRGIVGNKYYVKAYQMFRASKKEVAISRERFKQLQHEQKQTYTLRQVAQLIKKVIKPHKITIK